MLSKRQNEEYQHNMLQLTVQILQQHAFVICRKQTKPAEPIMYSTATCLSHCYMQFVPCAETGDTVSQQVISYRPSARHFAPPDRTCRQITILLAQGLTPPDRAPSAKPHKYISSAVLEDIPACANSMYTQRSFAECLIAALESLPGFQSRPLAWRCIVAPQQVRSWKSGSSGIAGKLWDSRYDLDWSVALHKSTLRFCLCRVVEDVLKA